jgi:hypothetical protein
MVGRKDGGERFLADPLDRESAVLNRKQGESHLDLAHSQGLDLLLRVEAVQVNLDIGVARQKDRKNSLENPALRRGAAADRQASGLTTGGVLCDFDGVLGVSDNLSSLLEKQSSRFRQSYRSAAAAKQLHADFPLKIANLMRERWLRNVEAVRRSAEMQLFGDRNEIPEVAKFHCLPLAAKDYIKFDQIWGVSVYALWAAQVSPT